MSSVLLVIHLFLALSIIGLVLLQRSEGGGLGIGGGGGLGGVATPQGTANILSRATAFCAAASFCTSLLLGILAGQGSGPKAGLLENVAVPAAQEQMMDQASEKADPALEENTGNDQQTDAPPAAPVAE